jgi:hypothetical protein
MWVRENKPLVSLVSLSKNPQAPRNSGYTQLQNSAKESISAEKCSVSQTLIVLPPLRNVVGGLHTNLLPHDQWCDVLAEYSCLGATAMMMGEEHKPFGCPVIGCEMPENTRGSQVCFRPNIFCHNTNYFRFINHQAYSSLAVSNGEI